jgi:ElaB/YqjD/DUF883 family membrane-anchored ribosome-binding protein
MQANQSQDILNSVHNIVQSNVSKMYKKIDDIIQSAKNYVEQAPENGQKIVDHVTSYTKYMHKVIEQIVQSYSELLNDTVFSAQGQIAEGQSLPSNESMTQLLNNFKEKFAQNIERAKNATSKIQSLVESLVG